MEKRPRRFTIRIGPLGLSLAAAAVTAVAFAAISLADSGGTSGNGATTQSYPAPAPGGGVGVMSFRANLSDVDRQKLEDFRSCMEANGAPGPPDPGHFDPGNPPKPPSAADQEKLKKAWETCKDKLPEDMQNAGPPQVHIGGDCASPPGAPGTKEQGNKQNQDQSTDSGTSSSGSDS